ncbi:MAG: efflux RND transporter permease subunit [Endozoicomonas sp.]|uniref:efflux RND transporter permease subunit n=1 Tax=Endozoicomonas sp. TaxID=1892382 RepID=UPI003D9BD6DF
MTRDHEKLNALFIIQSHKRPHKRIDIEVRVQDHPLARGLVLLAVMSLYLFAITGITGVKGNASYRAYFSEQDDRVKQLDEINKTFGLFDPLAVIVTVPEGETLDTSPGLLPAVRSLQDDLESLSSVKYVTSFESYVVDPEDEFASPIESQTPFQSTVASLLVSKDRLSGLIVLDVSLDSPGDAKEILLFNQKVQSLVDQHLNQPLGTTSLLSGALALNTAYIDVVKHDIKLFAPGLILLMMAVLIALFRRLSIALLLIATGTLSVLSAFGILGYFQISLTAINVFVPIIIIALAIVTAMHNVLGMYQHVASGAPVDEAVRNSYQENLTPLTLSSLTTAAGFLFLLTSPSPPIQIVGISVALGIVLSYLLTLTWLRFFLSSMTLNKEEASRVLNRISPAPLKAFCSKHYKKLITSSLLLLILSGAALTQLRIDDNVFHYFPEQHPFRTSLNQMDERFSGATTLNYVVRLSEQDTVRSQQIKELHQLTQWLKQRPGINQILMPPAHLLEAGALAKAQQLLNLSSSGLERLITPDGKQIRLELHLNALSSRALMAFDAQTRQWLALNTPSLAIKGGTSAEMMFAQLSHQNALNMFSSLLIALLLITLLIGVLLRSWTAMILAMFSNFFPVLLVYGFWSATGGPISLGCAVVVGMIMGVIVDDTLHVLIKYQRQRKASGPDKALDAVWQSVMPAVWVSSLVLIIALLVGLLSDFRPIAELSFLSIATLIAALLTDLMVLPAFLGRHRIKNRV